MLCSVAAYEIRRGDCLERQEAYFRTHMFTIIENAFSCIFWGVLVSSLCMLLFIALIRGWYRNATFTPVSVVVSVLLFLFLSVQSVLLVGAVKIISLEEEYEEHIHSIVANAIGTETEAVTAEQSDVVLRQFFCDYPLVAQYIEEGRFSGQTALELPHAITRELSSYMRWYIVRRLLWCLAFVVVGSVVVIRTISKSNSKKGIGRKTYVKRSVTSSYRHRRR